MGYYERSMEQLKRQINNLSDEQRKKYGKYIKEDYAIIDRHFRNPKGTKNEADIKDLFYNRYKGVDWWDKGFDDERVLNAYEKRYQSDQTISNEGKPIVAESTTQGAQQVGLPENEKSTISEKETEGSVRRNKRKGKRGFSIKREAGQGINI